MARAARQVAAAVRRIFSPRLIFKCAMNMGGLRGALQELLRNALLHGNATNVWVTVTANARGQAELHVLDDGCGIGYPGRECFGTTLGYTTADGTGSGGRLASVTLCQVLEAITVTADEPDTAYRIILPLPAFIDQVCAGTWSEIWEAVPRTQTPFPPAQATGTLIILRDFRASDADAPFDASRMRDTSRKITTDEILRIVPIVLPPDLARKIVVDGRRVRPPEVEGFPLWAMTPAMIRGLPEIGIVSGDIRFAPNAEGRWFMIGGTTSTIPVQHFVDDCREYNSDLAKRIPAELTDRRNTGYIRVGVLEKYPTQSREHLDPAFFDSADAVKVVEYLATVVGPRIREQLAKYEEQPATEQTHAALARVIARIHQSQGITPGTLPGGSGDGPAGKPEDAQLDVNRITLRLEAATGADADAGTFAIRNAFPGETFSWNDQGRRLITERSMTGDRVTVTAIAQVGVHPIEVRSNQYQQRRRTVSVDVYQPQSAGSTEFLLSPMNTEMCVGEEKRITVRSQGASSGEYRWEVARRHGGQLPADVLAVHPNGRQAILCPKVRGDYTVSCIDTHDDAVRATCRVEVREQRQITTAPPSPETGHTGSGTGGVGPRRSTIDREFEFHYDGTTFKVRGAPFLTSPWDLEVANQLIHVSDVHPMNSGARSQEERDLYVANCLASAVTAYNVATGIITQGDVGAMSAAQDRVLRAYASLRSGGAATRAASLARRATAAT